MALAAAATCIGTVTVALLRCVLDRRPITTDKVFGAVAAYILIALSSASLFGVLQIFEPHAFNAAVAHGPDGRLNWSDMMYFSFTVLTSTGFGEITPASPFARRDRDRTDAGRDVRGFPDCAPGQHVRDAEAQELTHAVRR